MQTGNPPFVVALGAHSYMRDNVRSFPRSQLRVGDSYDPIPHDRDLDRNAANFQPLTPLTFLERAAEVFSDRVAIADGRRRHNYRDFHTRSKKLASELNWTPFVSEKQSRARYGPHFSRSSAASVLRVPSYASSYEARFA